MVDARDLLQWDELTRGRHQRKRGNLRNVGPECLPLADLDPIVALSLPELGDDFSAECHADALCDFPGCHAKARSGHAIDPNLELGDTARLLHSQVRDAVHFRRDGCDLLGESSELRSSPDRRRGCSTRLACHPTLRRYAFRAAS